METSLLIIAYIIIASYLLFWILKKNKLINKNLQKKVLEKTIKEDYEKKCMFVFIKCREKSISTFDTPQELEILNIIASSYGIADIEEAKKCYYIGQTLVRNKEISNQNKIIDEIRKKDQKEFEENEKRAKIKGKDKYFSSISAYNSSMQHEYNSIDEFNKKICDESNIYEKFGYLKFSNVKYLILKSKNIRVSGFVKIDENIKLLGVDALLDGSLKISIIDSDENVIGYGYYSTGTFNYGTLVDSGFTKHKKRFSTICIINDYAKINETSILKYRIEPVNMWLIEY